MSRVLVTGSTGFIGRHLVRRLLEQGDEVGCLVRDAARGGPLVDLGATLVPGDVTDPRSLGRAVQSTEQVYHLAGLTKALRVTDFHRVNARGTEHVAAACAARQSPPGLLVVSSLAAAGPAIGNEPRRESDPEAPVSHYGRSKRAGEQRAESYADRVPISILRPPAIYGPGDRSSLEIFASIDHGWHLVPGKGDARISFMHVEDLVGAILRVASRGVRLCSGDMANRPGYYFIAPAETPTYAGLGEIIATALGRPRVRIARLPHSVLWTVATFNEFLGRLSGRARVFGWDKVREATAGSWICRSDRLADELGFTAETDLQSGLRETVEWYRREGWLRIER